MGFSFLRAGGRLWGLAVSSMAQDESCLARLKLYQRESRRMDGCQVPHIASLERRRRTARNGRFPAEPVDHGLAEPSRGHEGEPALRQGMTTPTWQASVTGAPARWRQLPTGVHEGLARLAHERPNMKCIFQEFRSPKATRSHDVVTRAAPLPRMTSAWPATPVFRNDLGLSV